ncbi:MAG: hypothetical protein H0V14_06205 [Chitinophagaceae bacterium]|jgi:hypothetical protein|nr:hypothetical protein [Chitinophagaceae bacterium]
MKNILLIILIIGTITSCESRVTTVKEEKDSSKSVENILDSIENNIEKSWDTVKVKVNKGIDTLKVKVNEGVDTLKNNLDKTFNKEDSAKK